MLTHAHLLAINAQTGYPVDGQATATDDLGHHLPADVLVDLHIRWPSTLGPRAFLSSVVVGRALSITIQACQAIDQVDGFIPLGAATVALSEARGRPVAIEPQADGVGGWVCFGPAILQINYRGRFSTPGQSILCPRAARAYQPLPVSGLAVPGGIAVGGTPLIRARSPVQITPQTLTIDGYARQCLVFSLEDQASLQTFAGPCGGRPDSRSCGDPQPIEFVGGIGPDCDGILTLDFGNGFDVRPTPDGHGAVISHNSSLSDICGQPRIPDATGRLPSEYAAGAAATWHNPIVVDASDSTSDDGDPSPELPLALCLGSFGDQLWLATMAGEWGFAEALPAPPRGICPAGSDSGSGSDSTLPFYGSIAAAERNIAILDSSEETAIARTITADLNLQQGPAAARRNGGVISNYRHIGLSNQLSFWIAVVDYDDQTLRIRKFNGVGYRDVRLIFCPGLRLNHWYTLEFTVTPGPGPAHTTVHAKLMDGLRLIADTESVTVLDYRPYGGSYGLYANRSVTRFSYFAVE